MKFKFSKIEATGNDFVLIDNRDYKIDPYDKELIHKLCDRRKGIGADGVIFYEESDRADFKMICMNSDGSEAPMCGNAGRSILFFHGNSATFETANSVYKGTVEENIVTLTMNELKDLGEIDLSKFSEYKNALYMYTGVYHTVFEVENLAQYPVVEKGRAIRHDKIFPVGTNVNFIEKISDNKIFVRTYERGVEDETLSCGTGATASAIAASKFYDLKESIDVETRGGLLTIEFDSDFSNIKLKGEVRKVFIGSFYS